MVDKEGYVLLGGYCVAEGSACENFFEMFAGTVPDCGRVSVSGGHASASHRFSGDCTDFTNNYSAFGHLSPLVWGLYCYIRNC